MATVTNADISVERTPVQVRVAVQQPPVPVRSKHEAG